MKISLDHVVPLFLEKEKTDSSGIWNKKMAFSQGEKTLLVAPSGSGKTSLIHFLYGLRQDYSGNILLDNKNISTFSAEDFSFIRREKMSIVFQDLRLFQDHTVLQNIEIKRALKAFDGAGSIGEMASALGIENKLSKPVSTCSFGEKQRIAIIRALQQPFDVLIMDEPFSHLDKNNRDKALELIESEAAKRKAGIILADLETIDNFKADQLLYL